jgi:glycosyltransferase involved in cell wall biosynthesis
LSALHPSPVAPAVELAPRTTWLQILSHVDPQFGGIASSVPQFSRATEVSGNHRCPLVGFCAPEEMSHLSAAEQLHTRRLPSGRMRWMVDAGLRGQLKQIVRGALGVHIHGIWETHCSVTAKMARTCKRPYMISAHGMLDQWALRHKRIKKATYAALVETGNLRRAACLRALTRDEVDDYRRVGLTTPIALVPGGVTVPSVVTSESFFIAHPELKGKRIVLFLGRLHPKKGLHLLLQAWANTKRSDTDHLVIAGPDPENLLASLQRIVESNNLGRSVTFAGMLNGEKKWGALAACSLFVLPSFSEGFSVAVLEALGVGRPVVITRPCHFPEVAEYGCGWVIDPELAQLELALEEFLKMSGFSAEAIGYRGKCLIEKKFTWSVVGKQMAEVYDWIQGAQRPESVEIL